VIGSYTFDQTILGQLVYDNSGASAPLSSVFQGSATAAGAACPAGSGNYCEPGLPLPFSEKVVSGALTMLSVTP
jgi:hypothetical protein